MIVRSSGSAFRSIQRTASSVAVGALLMTMSGAATTASGPPPAQTRCGWLSNPSPANWSLSDRDGRWTIGTQGGWQAQGINRMPDLDRAPAYWVVTNVGEKGYGCACLSVDTDRRRMRITRVISTRQQPLAVCRSDRRLPPFE